MKTQTQESDDSSVRQLFRDSYLTFMDDCERLWHRHCRTLSELASSEMQRNMEASQKGAQHNAGAVQEQVRKERQALGDSFKTDLENAFKSYAERTAKAWSKARDVGADDSTLWHVGVAQMNVAWNYGVLSALCRS
jgi:hypothetical protein